MPDLLLELFSEEIPARMQAQAAKDLERLVIGALSDRGLLFEAAKSFAGPRRLTLAIAGLPAKQPDVREELKGPKVDAPQAALDGFLRKTGLTKEQLRIDKTPKGNVYLGVIARKGRATTGVLSQVLPDVLDRLPWPKSMRWPQERGGMAFEGISFGKAHVVRWVRPLHGMVCTFDGDVVPFEFAGVQSGNVTYGHRFLSHGPIEVRRFEDYEEKLRKAHVILDAAQRKEIILHDARNAAFAQRLALVEDAGLIEEVVGLAEWPVVLIGSIESEFMELPPEILQTSMRTHQKYFALQAPPLRSGGGGSPRSEARESGFAKKSGETEGARLAPKFVVVANMIAADGGKQIVAGNERVLRARLSDAKFFWDQDRKRTLQSRVDDLNNIVFHAKLGTQYERVERIVALAKNIASIIGADVVKAERAARLCKADLTTGIVGEFPELQGTMGRYYALHDGEDAAVANAIRDHYRPVGASGDVPRAKESIAVALADKIDTLRAFFSIGEKPSGSGDPFALRRAALGVIKTILQNEIHILLTRLGWPPDSALDPAVEGPLMHFFADRMKVVLREEGVPHGLVEAVFSQGADELKGIMRENNLQESLADPMVLKHIDLLTVRNRIQALQAFLKTDDGTNLLVAYRRAANILRDEEKRDKTSYDGEPDPELLAAPEEKALFVALATASELIRAEVERERFVEAMGVMVRLRKPVDAFFEKVTVNDKNPELRANRLKLLSRLRSTLHLVADFSKIEG